jgi:hypothetical protein
MGDMALKGFTPHTESWAYPQRTTTAPSRPPLREQEAHWLHLSFVVSRTAVQGGRAGSDQQCQRLATSQQTLQQREAPARIGNPNAPCRYCIV